MYLSVIIPTLNRAEFLNSALNSLIAQTCRSDLFEVIVVDNGSTDNTLQVCQEFKERFGRFSYFFDKRPGLHVGRHVGLKNAIGDILVYGDDDIRALPTWLEGIAESFQDPDVALVGGNCIPEYESTPPDWVESLWTETPWGRVLGQYSLIEFGNEIKEISPYSVWGCNFSIRKDVLKACGGFHPDGMPKELLRFRGDGETAVSSALIAANKKTLYNPKASVYHWVSNNRMTADFLYQRSYAQGISDSFTMIRQSGRCYSITNLKKLARLIVRKYRVAIHNYVSNDLNGSTVKEAITSGYADGFLYHHIEVARDGKLFEWVLREDYLEVGDDFPSRS